MALLIHLTRTAEDETSVSYRYGPTSSDQPQQVTFLKETGELVSTTADHGGLVAGWVRRERRKTGTWIPRGVIAS